MKNLEELVKELVDKKNKEKQIEKKLQEILKSFLCNYYIKFGTFKIDPILVEAYYYNEEQGFKDKSVHAARNESGKITTHAKERQKDNFGKLYIHNVKNKNDGLDICLSKGDYFFSILIKNAIINDKYFATQSNVSKFICDKCQGCDEVPNCIYYNEVVLKKREQSKDITVIFLPRKNIPSNKKLAAVSLDDIKTDLTNLSLAQGYGKQWECSIIALSEVRNTEKAKKLADSICGCSIESQYFEKALNYMKEQEN